MTMLNPCHPGEILRDNIDSAELSVRETASQLGCDARSLSRFLNGKTGVTTELAQALEQFGWGKAEFWMRLQSNYQAAH